MKRSTRQITVGLLSLLSLLVLTTAPSCGGGEENRPAVAEATATPEEAVENTPQDYFPAAKGTRWVYEITLGKADPQLLQTFIMRYGDLSYVVPYFGYYTGSQEKELRTFRLVLSIAGQVPKQGPLQYSRNFELHIEEDELGVFEGYERLFWSIDRTPNFQVTETAFFSPDSPYVPKSTTGAGEAQEVYTYKLILFLGESETKVGQPPDVLTFVGVENDKLHFVRDAGYFTEDTWFEKGKGLVRLEQKVGGVTSMTWTLMEFSSGS